MQRDKKILYNGVARVLRKRRLKLKQKLTIFCYENDIPTTTMTSLEKAKTEASFFNIVKISHALGLSLEEFGKLLDDELPEGFLDME